MSNFESLIRVFTAMTFVIALVKLIIDLIKFTTKK